ncbi:hypothetical protein ABT364_14465 [Massilia sp. SR12]
MTSPQFVLCIPGTWANRSEFLEQIVRESGGYIFAGGVLMHMESKFGCSLYFEEIDPRMQQAFEAASPHWRNTPELDAISTHKSVVYLVGTGGSRHAAESLMRCAAGVLKAGGLGVKVESAGLAHSPQAWLEYVDDLHLGSACDALVVYVTGQQAYSCGMHNLGLPEAMTDNIGHKGSVALLRTFNRYQFIESPELFETQTFAAEVDGPVYVLSQDQGVRYGADSLFENPYGCWRLTGVAARH